MLLLFGDPRLRGDWLWIMENKAAQLDLFYRLGAALLISPGLQREFAHVRRKEEEKRYLGDTGVYLSSIASGLADSAIETLTSDRAAKCSMTERKTKAPSALPRIASVQRSGCGIMPSTLRRALTMPAMLRAEPLGLASGVIVPSGSQYRKRT